MLDLMLPGIDGLEVYKQIQRDRHVPVLMLTARDSEADLLVGLGVGTDDYMTKPFNMQELVARLRCAAGVACGGGAKPASSPRPPWPTSEVLPLHLVALPPAATWLV